MTVENNDFTTDPKIVGWVPQALEIAVPILVGGP